MPAEGYVQTQCARRVGFEMEALGGTKVVLYTDKGLVQTGVAEMVIKAIKSSSLELVGVYDKIVQDARIDLINATGDPGLAERTKAYFQAHGLTVAQVAQGKDLLGAAGSSTELATPTPCAIW
jgi:hypothetical protein